MTNNLKLIGSGNFGKIFQYNENYAIKQFKLFKDKNELLLKTEDLLNYFLNEINALATLRYHPNILHFEFTQGLNIIFELCEMDLLNYWQYEKSFLTPQNVLEYEKNILEIVEKRFIPQILNAILFIHLNGFIHGDIKPENILVKYHKNSKDIMFKISDFNNSEKISRFPHLIRNRTYQNTSPPYRAPEMHHTPFLQHTKKIDFWSFGLVIYEFFSKRQIFHKSDYFLELQNYISLPKITLIKAIGNKLCLGSLKFDVSLNDPISYILKELLVISPPEKRFDWENDKNLQHILKRYFAVDVETFHLNFENQIQNKSLPIGKNRIRDPYLFPIVENMFAIYIKFQNSFKGINMDSTVFLAAIDTAMRCLLNDGDREQYFSDCILIFFWFIQFYLISVVYLLNCYMNFLKMLIVN